MLCSVQTAWIDRSCLSSAGDDVTDDVTMSWTTQQQQSDDDESTSEWVIKTMSDSSTVCLEVPDDDWPAVECSDTASVSCTECSALRLGHHEMMTSHRPTNERERHFINELRLQLQGQRQPSPSVLHRGNDLQTLAVLTDRSSSWVSSECHSDETLNNVNCGRRRRTSSVASRSSSTSSTNWWFIFNISLYFIRRTSH